MEEDRLQVGRAICEAIRFLLGQPGGRSCLQAVLTPSLAGVMSWERGVRLGPGSVALVTWCELFIMFRIRQLSSQPSNLTILTIRFSCFYL